MNVVPATISRYVVGTETIRWTWEVLAERGQRGLEATVLWMGRVLDSITAEVVALYVPEQIAYRSAEGVAVEVTSDGLSELIRDLPKGVFVLCRVHSHPGPAYHSELDDGNMIIAHPGAISIVVPDFAQAPFDLTLCSVNRLAADGEWHELAEHEIQDTFQVRP